MCQIDPEMQRKSQAIIDAADTLDGEGWTVEAQALRMSHPPQEVLEGIEDDDRDEDEKEFARRTLRDLIDTLED